METKVTQQDLIGDLKGFPIEVVEEMLKYQKQQTGKKDISVFQNDRCQDACDKGFRWSETTEGHYFWKTIIRDREFDIFFERYPKLSKNVYIRGDKNNGKGVIEELEKRGGINKYDYHGNAEALYFIDPSTNYIVMASKMEGPLQTLLKTVYTEISPCNTEIVELTMEEIANKLDIDVKLLRIKD